MRKVIIVKVGSTLPALLARKGDFEDWVVSGMGAANGDVKVVDARDGNPLPDYDEIAGVIVPGSHEMVTEHLPWSERVAAWLPGLVARGIPTLGICYGHQLLAYALGGEVGDNPHGREYGTIAIHLEEDARDDPLLGGLSKPVEVHVSHTQSVLRLPPGARRLAYSARDANEVFVVGDTAWGVQFHPEFDAEVVTEYIGHSASILRAEGQDPTGLAAGCHDTPDGATILRRFLHIAAAGPATQVEAER
jgi:GMP synthase (glutamine-hydrolysing)